MNAHAIFIHDGKLRAIWRFLLSVIAFVVVVIAVQLLIGIAFGIAGAKPSFFLANSLAALLTLPALLGVVALFTRALDKRPLGSAGMALGGKWKSELGHGLAVGAVMILSVAGAEWALGVAAFAWSGGEVRGLFLTGCGGLVVLAIAATNEEIIFRGYAFQRLVESVGAVGAVLLLSVLFGAIHLGNPNSGWVGAANTALVGIPFSIAYLRTRMLWLPIGMHFAWNFVQGFILGLPVSGMTFPVSLLHAEVNGPTIITGGAYGPEGGLLATGVIVLTTGYLAFSPRISMSDQTRALILAPVSAPASEAVALNIDQPGPDGGTAAS